MGSCIRVHSSLCTTAFSRPKNVQPRFITMVMHWVVALSARNQIRSASTRALEAGAEAESVRCGRPRAVRHPTRWQRVAVAGCSAGRGLLCGGLMKCQSSLLCSVTNLDTHCSTNNLYKRTRGLEIEMHFGTLGSPLPVPY